MAAELENPASKMRLPWGMLIRIAGTLLALGIVFQFIPLGEVWAHVKAMPPLVWFGVFAAFLLGHAFAAAKWRWMIGGQVSYPRALKAHFAGLAANLALPGVAGGDLVRAGMLMKSSDTKTHIALGSLIDRLVDVAMLVVLSAIGAIWLGSQAGVSALGLSIAAALLIATGLTALLFLGPIARTLKARAPSGKLRRLIHSTAEALEDMSTRRGLLLFCAGLSLAIQAGFAFLTATLATNLGTDAPLAAWFFAWPLAKLIATLPISLGGLGVREASLSGLMVPLGIASAGVIAAGLVWQTILWAAGALGALIQILWPPVKTQHQTGTSHG